MTSLLASVTGPDEAAVALAHGADIIDLKDASRGALGALDRDVLRATVAAVGGRRPASAVTGDLPMEPDVIWDVMSMPFSMIPPKPLDEPGLYVVLAVTVAAGVYVKVCAVLSTSD